MLDGSRSVRPSNFVFMKNYVKEFVDVVDELGPNRNQIGVVSMIFTNNCLVTDLLLLFFFN